MWSGVRHRLFPAVTQLLTPRSGCEPSLAPVLSFAHLCGHPVGAVSAHYAALATTMASNTDERKVDGAVSPAPKEGAVADSKVKPFAAELYTRKRYTLLFCLRRSGSDMEVMLGMKKRGFGAGTHGGHVQYGRCCLVCCRGVLMHSMRGDAGRREAKWIWRQGRAWCVVCAAA